MQKKRKGYPKDPTATVTYTMSQVRTLDRWLIALWHDKWQVNTWHYFPTRAKALGWLRGAGPREYGTLTPEAS